MKCTVEKQMFLQHLQKVANIVSRKPTIPILANIKLEAAGDELKLTTTNLEIIIETTMKTVVAEDGTTTLPAKSLADLVEHLAGTEIQLDSDERFHCKITCGNAAFKLLGLDPVDFPEPFEVEAKSRITLKIADYNRIIDQISYAVSFDDSRKVLHGILFTVENGLLTGVATDGKRLALTELVPEKIEGENRDVIIPCRAAIEVKRLLEGEAPVTLAFSENYLKVQCGTTTLRTKLIEGTYPRFRAVIPKEFSKTVTLTTAPLLASLDLVSVPINGNGNIELKFSSGNLGLHCESNLIGEGGDSLEIAYNYEDEMQFFFNPNFLRDPLKYSGSETLNLRMNDRNNPIALENNNGFMYILMPVRAA